MPQSQVDEGGAENRVVDFRRHTRSSRPVRTVPRVDSKGHLCGARTLPCAHAAHAEGKTVPCRFRGLGYIRPTTGSACGKAHLLQLSGQLGPVFGANCMDQLLRSHGMLHAMLPLCAPCCVHLATGIHVMIRMVPELKAGVRHGAGLMCTSKSGRDLVEAVQPGDVY